MTSDQTGVLGLSLVATIFLILSIILILGRARTFEMKLILIGVFFALAAFAVGNVTGLHVGGEGNTAGFVAISTGYAPVALTKVGTILILLGVAVRLLSSGNLPENT